MNPEDGRVVSNFIMQALKGEPLTIYGDGNQTRSFQYIHDLVDGLIQAMESNYKLPINLGNPTECTIANFAECIRDKIGTELDIQFMPALKDDPKKRKPDITKAKEQIGWSPKFTVDQGIDETIEYFKRLLQLDIDC